MRKGEATRQRIIAEAAPIFNQRGFAGCSMQDLMEATGLEKGGLYRHFACKEDLAVAAFRYSLSSSTKLRTDHLDATTGWVKKLRKSIQLFVDAPSAVAGGCPLMNAAIDSDDGNSALRALALQGVRDWRTRLARIVTAGQVAGEIRRDTNPRRIANTIISTLEGALMISRLERSKRALRDAQESLKEMLDGISR